MENGHVDVNGSDKTTEAGSTQEVTTAPAQQWDPFALREKIMLSFVQDLPDFDEVQIEEYLKTRKLVKEFNDLAPPTYYPGIRITDLHSTKKQVELLSGIFRIPPAKAMFLFIKPPLRVDIGINTEFKGSCQANYNLVILDAGKVTIGTRTMFGPNVQLLAGGHSIYVEERRKFATDHNPITIGDDVWIGGGASIIGPCTIGNGVTVAAGSVVRGNIPDNVVVAGVPAKIVKRLDPPAPFETPEVFKLFFKDPEPESAKENGTADHVAEESKESDTTVVSDEPTVNGVNGAKLNGVNGVHEVNGLNGVNGTAEAVVA